MTRPTLVPADATRRPDANAHPRGRRTMRAACGAALLLAVAMPAHAQTSNVVAYGLIDLQFNQFPGVWVDWSLGSDSGTLPKTAQGTQIPIAPFTPVGRIVAVGFRDVMSNQTVCRIEVELSGPSQCTPRPISTGCSITLSTMVNNACMVVLRAD